MLSATTINVRQNLTHIFDGFAIQFHILNRPLLLRFQLFNFYRLKLHCNWLKCLVWDDRWWSFETLKRGCMTNTDIFEHNYRISHRKRFSLKIFDHRIEIWQRSTFWTNLVCFILWSNQILELSFANMSLKSWSSIKQHSISYEELFRVPIA